MAQAMQDAMNAMGSTATSNMRVITGLADITNEKRSNSNRGKNISPDKANGSGSTKNAPLLRKIGMNKSSTSVDRNDSPSKTIEN